MGWFCCHANPAAGEAGLNRAPARKTWKAALTSPGLLSQGITVGWNSLGAAEHCGSSASGAPAPPAPFQLHPGVGIQPRQAWSPMGPSSSNTPMVCGVPKARRSPHIHSGLGVTSAFLETQNPAWAMSYPAIIHCDSLIKEGVWWIMNTSHSCPKYPLFQSQTLLWAEQGWESLAGALSQTLGGLVCCACLQQHRGGTPWSGQKPGMLCLCRDIPAEVEHAGFCSCDPTSFPWMAAGGSRALRLMP